MKYISLILVIAFMSCSQKNFRYVKKDYDNETSIYQKVDLSDLLKNYEDYDGKYIQVSGFFIGNINESAMYSKEGSKEGIWISFKDELIDDNGNTLLKNNTIYDLSDSDVTLKGKFDSKEKGNLGLYKGSLTEIIYFSNYPN